MNFFDLQAVGMPFGFYFRLLRVYERRQLDTISLPDFLALWQRDHCLKQRPDGSYYVLFGEYAEMQSVLADIGGTIGGTSHATPLQLTQLSRLNQLEDQHRLWQGVVIAADALVKMFTDPQSERPRSIHHMMSQLLYTRAKIQFPQLADAETRGKMGDTEIDFDDIEDDWRLSAHNAFNIGMALAKQHPDFYYSMAEFDNPTGNNGSQNCQAEQSNIHFKREYHLAQCRLWANICRPDLVGVLGG